MAVHARRDARHQNAVAVHGLIVVQHRLWIIEPELHQPTVHTALTLGHQSIATDEAARLVEGHAPREASVQWCVLLGDVVTPVAVRLFHSQRVHCVVAGQDQAARSTGPPESVKGSEGELGGDV